MQRRTVLLFIVTSVAAPRLVAATQSDALTVIVRFHAAPGREDEARERLENLAKFVRQHSPGTVFKLHQSAKEPTIFVMYEVFPTKEALDNQPKTVLPAFTKQFGPAPAGLFTKPPEPEFLRAFD